MLLRGKPAELVKQCLDAYARMANRRSRRRPFVVTFRGKGHRLFPTLAKPRLAWKLLSLIAAGKATTLWIPLAADGLWVKNNIRVFYPRTARGKRSTAKIVVPSEYRSGSLKNEVVAREALAGQDFLVPLHGHDQRDFSWLEEEFIAEDKAVSEQAKTHRFLDEIASSLYGARQSSRAVAAAVTAMDVAMPELEAVFREFGLDSQVLSGMLSYGFIHGDLSPANMLVERSGKLWIIDWELAGFAPIAWDLKKLFEHDESAVLAALDRIRRDADLPASDQMLLALACQYAALQRDHDKRLAYLRNNRNKKTAKALEMIAAQKAALASALRRLDAMRASTPDTERQ
jgi:hypothetical protein